MRLVKRPWFFKWIITSFLNDIWNDAVGGWYPLPWPPTVSIESGAGNWSGPFSKRYAAGKIKELSFATQPGAQDLHPCARLWADTKACPPTQQSQRPDVHGDRRPL